MGCKKLREIMLKKISRRYSCLLCSTDGLLWCNWDCCCTVLVKGISFFLLHSFLTPWALLEPLLSLADTAKNNNTRHENFTNNLTFLMVSVWNWDWHQWSSKIGGGLMPLSTSKCFQVWTTPKNVTFLMLFCQVYFIHGSTWRAANAAPPVFVFQKIFWLNIYFCVTLCKDSIKFLYVINIISNS